MEIAVVNPEDLAPEDGSRFADYVEAWLMSVNDLLIARGRAEMQFRGSLMLGAKARVEWILDQAFTEEGVA